MRARLLLAPMLCGALAISGCHKAKAPGNSLDAMDSQLVNGAVTTESRKELAADIKVDPRRAHHGGAVAAHQPGDRDATVSLASAAERQAHHLYALPATTEDAARLGSVAGCTDGLVYASGWAKKLPADLPVHPRATLQEAAGHDGPCAIRVASFTVPGDPSAVRSWYEAKAQAGGYAVQRGTRDTDETLAGARGDDAFILFFGKPADGATPVDYIWTHGG